jgi:hypothetical protein
MVVVTVVVVVTDMMMATTTTAGQYPFPQVFLLLFSSKCLLVVSFRHMASFTAHAGLDGEIQELQQLVADGKLPFIEKMLPSGSNTFLLIMRGPGICSPVMCSPFCS